MNKKNCLMMTANDIMYVACLNLAIPLLVLLPVLFLNVSFLPTECPLGLNFQVGSCKSKWIQIHRFTA